MRTLLIHEFPGFYQSELSYGVDEAEMQEVDSLYEDEASYKAAMNSISDHVDYKYVWLDVAKEWLGRFEIKLDDECGVAIKFKFDRVVSPREYNFTTDRLFVNISDEDAESLYGMAFSHENIFKEVIEDMFTSRSGFISFYSNELSAWKARPFVEMNEVELGVLLSVVLRAECGEEVRDWIQSLSYAIDFSTILGMHLAYDAWQSSVDKEVVS